MPVVVGPPLTVSLLPPAPTAADSATTFLSVAASFFNAVWTMVDQVNLISASFATPLTPLPPPPSGIDGAFAAHADTYLAAFPGLVSDVNGMITALSLACSAITALPTVPSRSGDPVNFASRAATFLTALTTLRTQLNAFIAALNIYNPSSTRFDGTGVHWDSTTHTWDAG